MDKIKQAAIIMLGMGERHAAEILKAMDPKEVEAIIETINHLGNVTEKDVIEALNAFLKDSSSEGGINIVSKEIFKNSIASLVESKKFENDGMNHDRIKWLDIFKLKSTEVIYSIIQDEHPQVIAAVSTLILSSEKASEVIRRLPKEKRNEVIVRMASIGPVSTFGMEAFATFLERELHSKEKYNEITVNGVEAVANLISYLDKEAETEILEGISGVNNELYTAIQEKIIPFERLAQLDKRSLQTLLSEVDNEDLILALKGTDPSVKAVFLSNMASKSADILRDELEARGPVKISNVLDAQKRIINQAKKLAEEDKIIMTTKADSGIVF